MGVEEISSEIEPANVEPALKVFPQIPDLQSVSQPSGKVDLLIGLNYLEVQPRDVAQVGGLSLWESRFGSGYLLGGTHPDIWLGSRGEALVLGALHMSHSTSLATYKVSHSTQSSKDKTREVDNVGIPGYGDEDMFEGRVRLNKRTRRVLSITYQLRGSQSLTLCLLLSLIVLA